MKRRNFLQSVLLAPVAAHSLELSAPDVRRLIVIEGNSLSTPWLRRIQIADWLGFFPWMRERRFETVSLAVGGSDIRQLNEPERTMRVDVLAQLNYEHWLVLWELSNSMSHGISVAETYATHRAYCLARRAKGFKVLMGTCISRNQQIHFHQPTFTWEQQQGINGMVRETWHEFADGLLDFDAVPELGARDAPLNPRYFLDGVHLTDEGSEIAAGVVLDAMKARYPTYYMPIVGG